MEDLIAQFTGDGLAPYSEEDLEKLTEAYRRNQLVRCRITKVGAALMPSVEQNNTLHKCFELVADNTDHRSKAHAKEACKIDIDYRDMGFVMVRPDGGIQFRYRSFSFTDLPAGRERDRVMDQAFHWCADQLGLTVEDMVEEAKSRMMRRAQ